MVLLLMQLKALESLSGWECGDAVGRRSAVLWWVLEVVFNFMKGGLLRHSCVRLENSLAPSPTRTTSLQGLSCILFCFNC